MGIKTKFNPIGGRAGESFSNPNTDYKLVYLVTIGASTYGTVPKITVKNLTKYVTTVGVSRSGQVSTNFILLGGKIFKTSTSEFISDIEGFTSIGCGYTGILACKNGVIYCFNTSGTLICADSSATWKSVEAPVYMYGESYRKWFYGLTTNNELYEITIGTDSITKTKKSYADRFPSGGNYYDSTLNYLKGTTVYTSSGSSVLTAVTSCVGYKSSYLPSSYKTDS